MSIPFPTESSPSPFPLLAVRPTPLHRRRGIELCSMPLQMPPPIQFSSSIVNESQTAGVISITTATTTTTISNGRLRGGRYTHLRLDLNGSSTGAGAGAVTAGLFGSGTAIGLGSATAWTPSSASVIGSKGPLQPHVSHLPRRKTLRRREV